MRNLFIGSVIALAAVAFPGAAGALDPVTITKPTPTAGGNSNTGYYFRLDRERIRVLRLSYSLTAGFPFTVLIQTDTGMPIYFFSCKTDANARELRDKFLPGAAATFDVADKCIFG